MQLTLTATDHVPAKTKQHNLVIREHGHWFPTDLCSKPISQNFHK